jgi:hypothetical protein
MRRQAVGESQGKWAGTYLAMGVLFSWFARFRTILVDTARYGRESARFESETAR